MEETENEKLLEKYREGYMIGFSDGYKQAMLEILEKQRNLEEAYMATPGVESRPPKRPY